MLIDTKSTHQDRKLSEIDVSEIRRLVATGQHSQAEVARRYGITRSWVSQLTRCAHDLFDYLEARGFNRQVLQDELPADLYRELMGYVRLERTVRAYRDELLEDPGETNAGLGPVTHVPASSRRRDRD